MRIAAKHLQEGMRVTALPMEGVVSIIDGENGTPARLRDGTDVLHVSPRDRLTQTHVYVEVRWRTETGTNWDDWQAPNGALLDVEVPA